MIKERLGLRLKASDMVRRLNRIVVTALHLFIFKGVLKGFGYNVQLLDILFLFVVGYVLLMSTFFILNWIDDSRIESTSLTDSRIGDTSLPLGERLDGSLYYEALSDKTIDTYKIEEGHRLTKEELDFIAEKITEDRKNK